MNNLAVANKASKNLLKQSILILISIMFFSAGRCSEEELKVELRNHRLTPEERAANTKVKIPLPEVIFESNFEDFPEAVFGLNSLGPPPGTSSVSEQSNFEIQARFNFPIRASLSNTRVIVDGQDVSGSCIFYFYSILDAQSIRCITGVFDSVGVHRFNVTVGARTTSWEITSVSTPVFTSFKPVFQYFPPSAPITIEAEFFDPNYDIKPGSVNLIINNVDVLTATASLIEIGFASLQRLTKKSPIPAQWLVQTGFIWVEMAGGRVG
jgi:hypothetical protein